MHRVLVVLLVAMTLAGCSAGASPAGSSVDAPPQAPREEESTGASVPPDVPSLSRVDNAGRSPDQVVLALIEARNHRDLGAAYSLYATPDVGLDTAAREWTEAHETYLDFVVREVRVTASDTAYVRVTYAVTSNPMSSAIRPVVVNEPGEWWPVYMVDGSWKVQWMPRQ